MKIQLMPKQMLRVKSIYETTDRETIEIKKINFDENTIKINSLFKPGDFKLVPNKLYRTKWNDLVKFLYIREGRVKYYNIAQNSNYWILERFFKMKLMEEIN